MAYGDKQETWVEERDRLAQEKEAGSSVTTPKLAPEVERTVDRQSSPFANYNRLASQSVVAPNGFSSRNGSLFVGKDYNQAPGMPSNSVTDGTYKRPDPFGTTFNQRLGLRKGGLIPGRVNKKTGADTVIDAKKGEYVLPVKTVDKIGKRALDHVVKVTTGKRPMGGMRGKGFASGGGVPSAYDRSMEIADNVGTKLKSWGRDAQPELAGQDTDVWNTNLVQSIKNWDAKQRNPDAIVDTHDNLNLPSDVFPLPARVQPRLNPPAAKVATPKQNRPMDFGPALAMARRSGGGYQGPTTTPEQDDASRMAAQSKLESGYAKSSAQQDQWRKDAQTNALNENLGALRKRADELAAPRVMSGKDQYDQSFVGQANMSNPSFRNAMAEQNAWKYNNTSRQDALKATHDQIASITGQRHNDMSDETTRRGQDETADWHKYSVNEMADAKRKDAAARMEELGLKREELTDRREERGALAKERADDRLESIKYNADSARRTKAMEMAKNKEGVYDRDLANTVYDDLKKQDEGYAYEEVAPALPKRTEGGVFGIGAKKLDAQPAKYEWRRPAIPKGKEGEVAQAQKLMAKYGNRAAAEKAYLAGERI